MRSANLYIPCPCVPCSDGCNVRVQLTETPRSRRESIIQSNCVSAMARAKVKLMNIFLKNLGSLYINLKTPSHVRRSNVAMTTTEVLRRHVSTHAERRTDMQATAFSRMSPTCPREKDAVWRAKYRSRITSSLSSDPSFPYLLCFLHRSISLPFSFFSFPLEWINYFPRAPPL